MKMSFNAAFHNLVITIHYTEYFTAKNCHLKTCHENL